MPHQSFFPTTNTVCPICGSVRCKERLTHNGYNLHTCQACRHVFTFPLPTAKELKDFYNALHDSKTDYTYTRYYGTEYSPAFMSVLNFARRNLSRNSTILDIGCANGVLMKLLTENGYPRVVGCDFSEKVLFNKAADQLDIRIGEVFEQRFSEGQFDLITGIYVLEHLLNPSQYIDYFRRLLRPQGYLFLEVPYIYGLGARLRGHTWTNLKPPEHLNYFSKRSLTYLLSKSHFSVSELSTPYPMPHFCIPATIVATIGLGGHLRAVAQSSRP
jgi:SAM-dependent methyltransferase